ncbi:hypothetical protein D3C87_638120 [compost metagenome]
MDGRVFEQVHRRELAREFLSNALSHSDRKKRVPADIEKAVANAHAADLQHVLPDRQNRLFHPGFRHALGLRPLHGHRPVRQFLAVDLPARCERHPVHADDMGRHHIVGQARLQVALQLACRRNGLALAGGIVSDKRLVLAVLLDDRGRVLDARMLAKPGFDGSEFDAEAAQLDLIVDPSQVFDPSVRQPPR